MTRVLDEIIAVRGLPQAIRCDNGPELTSRHFLASALEWKIELRHIQLSSRASQRRTRTWRASTGGCARECLRVSWFTNLFDARRKVANWKVGYNEQRPHSSLNHRTPAESARQTSYGKDAGSARFEKADGVSNFPQLRRRLAKL